MPAARIRRRPRHPASAHLMCRGRPASSAATGPGAWPALRACRRRPSRAGRTAGRCPVHGCGTRCRHAAVRPRHAGGPQPAGVRGCGCHRRGSARTGAAAAPGHGAGVRAGPRSAARWDARRSHWRGSRRATRRAREPSLQEGAHRRRNDRRARAQANCSAALTSSLRKAKGSTAPCPEASAARTCAASVSTSCQSHRRRCQARRCAAI